MSRLLHALPLVALWATVVGKLPALRRDPGNDALRSYWLAVLAVALAWTVLQPPVQLSVDRVTGVANLARLLGHGLAVGAACAAQAFLAYSNYPRDVARPRMRRRALAAAGTLAAMGTLFTLGRVHDETLDFIGRYASTPAILVYWLVFLAYLGVAQVDTIRLAWRWARFSDRAIIQLAGRLTAVGGLFVCAYIGYDLLYLAASQLDRAYLLGNQQLITRLLLTTAIVVGVVGSTMPAWGPRVGLPRLFQWVSRFRAYQRLDPLWRRLCQAVPEIALVPPSSRWRDLLTVRDLHFRLHGRIMEIHDAQLRLRPYRDPRVAETAAALGRRAGLDGMELRAVAEATSLAAAVRALARRQPVAGAQAPATTPVGMDPQREITDLPGEIAWLVRVAAAFRSSPLVRARRQPGTGAAGGAPAPGVPERPMSIRHGNQESARRVPRRLRVARRVGELLSPPLLIVVLALLVAWESSPTLAMAVFWGGVAAVSASVLPYAIILRGVRRGRLSDRNIGLREERVRFAVVALTSILVGLAVLAAFDAPAEMVALQASIAVGVTCGWVITLWWKISVHAAIAAGAATVLVVVFGTALLAVWPLVGLVAWSRVEVGDHTPAQVVAGVALGIAVNATIFTSMS